MFETIQSELGSQLSKSASITAKESARWSAYGAPEPVAVVQVGNEEDIVATVKYCNARNIRYVTRNGGNGWAKFPKTENLVMINLSHLNSATVSQDKATAVIGGGASVAQTLAAADAAGVIISTGNCNIVGSLGAYLGGGYGNSMTLCGYGADNILEMRVVTADGEVWTVSAEKEKDLFWALRGAGPNFGIVASATVKAYPMTKDERSAWSGALIFTEDKLEQIVQAIQHLELQKYMTVFMYFATSGPPAHAPVVVVQPWLFQGTPESGREAFKSLFEIGPMMDTTAVIPYAEWNKGGDMFCIQEGRKPCYAAGLSTLESSVWRDVWTKFVEFQQKPGAHQSIVLLEAYPMNDVRFQGEKSAAFAHRRTRFQVLLGPWYDDASLDGEAIRFGKEGRELLRTCRSEKDVTYINLCQGDEPLEEVYGDSLPRLRELKRVWDPENKFNQWFNIC